MSDAYRVAYAPEALDDLKAIYTYLAQVLQAPGTAQELVGRLRSQIRALDQLPARYPLVDWAPWNRMGMHKMPVGNFVVFYTVDRESAAVTVIRIVYGGRDLESLAFQLQ